MLALSPASWGRSASALARMAFFVGWSASAGESSVHVLDVRMLTLSTPPTAETFISPDEAAASMRASHSSGVRKSSTVRMGGSMQSTRRFGASTSTRRKSCAVRSPKPAFMPGWSARSMPPAAAISGGTGVMVVRRCAGAIAGGASAAEARVTSAHPRERRPRERARDPSPGADFSAWTLS